MRQAIIWTNDGLLTNAYMRHLASMNQERPLYAHMHLKGMDLKPEYS